MAFLTTKSSIYIALLIFIGCVSPFLHIIYGVRDTVGIFGYSYMSSFLNAFGRVNALLCASLFIKFAASKAQGEYKLIINLGANMFLYVASFFLLALFIPKKILFNKADFPVYFYWVSMLIMSVSSGFLLIKIQKAFIFTEAKLKNIISAMSRFMVKDAKKHVKPESIVDYKKDYINALKDGMS